MQLKDWCEKSGYSLSDVMREAGVSYTSVLRGARGDLNRYDVAKSISNVTRGKVKVAELCALHEPEE